MGRRRRTQADLAAKLGLSPAMISKLVARGMPLELVAARAWRAEHLDVRLVKEIRRPGGNGHDTPAPLSPFGRVKACAAAAAADVAWLPKLREALAGLPPALRGRVALPKSLWAALIGKEQLAALAAWEAEAKSAPAAKRKHGSDLKAPDVSTVLYSLAAGEARILPPTNNGTPPQ